MPLADSSPPTRPSLLVRIRDVRDERAWGEFVDLYGPLVYGFARRHGFQDADAADVTQEILRAVCRAAPQFEYDPRRGAFRAWLYTVARNKLRNALAARKIREQGSGDTAALMRLHEIPLPEEAPPAWDQEYEQRIFAAAAERVRPCVEATTWQAFWRTAVAGEPPQQVAAALQMTVAAVYLAKSRVLARLKAEVAELDGGGGG